VAINAPHEPKPSGPLDDPAQFLAGGLDLVASRAGGLALPLVARALERHGDDPLWQAVTAAIQQALVPDFHVRMLRDDLRNAAYRAAIERFAPGRSVLDIGTGSGLLAMMAARAGAGGTVSGLAQWLRLTFADDIIYENRPGSADNLHWRISLAPTDPRETMPGARYCAGGTYAADTLVTWCAPNVALASD